MQNIFFTLFFCITGASLYALPREMVRLEGEVTCKSFAKELELVASDGTVLDWETFSIESSETVSFLLPNDKASVLNQVRGQHPSEIFGHLKSNGQVILINPNGILFGSESRIDVENLIASSFDLFQKSGKIQHAGKIYASSIELMADEIYLFKGSICSADQIVIGDRERTLFLWAEEGSHIFADGLEGGQVRLLSRGMTDFHGFISAKGELRGGFVEVSGGHLCYDGFSDVRGAVNGTLLLDPTDITIGPLTANNLTAANFSFPLTCGGNSALSTRNFSVGPTSTIDVVTLTAQIGVGNVIIDSVNGAGGVGNITWNAGANFVYASANDLTLRAPNTGVVTILANVQNTGTGALIIDSQGPDVLINRGTNTQAVSFGSLNGITRICAPSANVILQAANTAANRRAQVGFFAGNGAVVNGPIEITCRTLSVFGAVPNSCYAHVGHGQLSTGANHLLTINATATINVNATGNITLQGSSFAPGAGTLCTAIIGHGSQSLTAGSVIRGNITVTSGADITIISNGNAATTGVTARIGHGLTAAIAGTNFLGDASIFVECAGNLFMRYSNSALGSAHNCAVGHTAAAGVLAGDVTVISGRNIEMVGFPATTSNQRLNIGHLTLSTDASTVNGNIRVFACQDILMDTRNSNIFGIGLFKNTPIPLLPSAVGDVEVVAGRDIIFTSNGTFPLSNAAKIGNHPVGALTNTRTFVAAGRNIEITGTQSAGIGGFGDIHVAAGGNITLTSTGAGTRYIGTDDTVNAVTPRITRVYANGNIIASNTVSPGRTVIGRGLIPSAVPYTCSVDLRSGGDIQLAFPFSTNAAGTLLATSGDIFIEADTQLLQGSLWTADSAQVTSICGVTPNLPILRSSFCPLAISSGSPSIFANGLGALSFNTGVYGISFGLQTTGGNISLHSAPFQTNAIAQNLVIGTGANNANIITIDGNIEIWGTQTSTNCVRANSFQDIVIDMALTTTGSVTISANNNIEMTPASSIDTSGGNSPVTLIVDNQAPVFPLIGLGLFEMDAASSIDTGSGALQIYTALQSANSINGLLNGSSFVPGTLFTDTNQEIWCTYFCSPLIGNPFTISYKNCLRLITQQAMIIADQLLVSLHPYNEFPGWHQEFHLIWSPLRLNIPSESYLLRRRNLNYINHPKSYTLILSNL